MEKINIEEIFKNNGCHLTLLKNAHCKDGKPGSEYDRLKSAIKEIVEAVVDRCAKEAKIIYNEDGLPTSVKSKKIEVEYLSECSSTAKVSPDKKSILQVKQMVDYGTD